MVRWGEAASEKRLDQFEIPWDALHSSTPSTEGTGRSLCNETKPERAPRSRGRVPG